jgi:hypothetical protein
MSTTDEKFTTLQDLGLTGSALNPLQIFVVPRHATPVGAGPSASTQAEEKSEVKSHDSWGFASTDRGKATFQTCLAVLMGDVRSWPKKLRSYLQALFRITHFPPAIEALQTLATENKLVPMAVLVLATFFRELALRIIPMSVTSGGIESDLEGSRQLFAWLESESAAGFECVNDPEVALARYVKFEEVDGALDQNYNPGERCEFVEVLATGEATQQLLNLPSPPRSLRKVRVRACITCKEYFQLLATATWGRYDSVVNHYVDFRGNTNDPWNHRLSPLIHPTDFNRLLLDANSSQLSVLCRLQSYATVTPNSSLFARGALYRNSVLIPDSSRTFNLLEECRNRC